MAEGFQGQLAAQVRIDPAAGQGGQEGGVLVWAREHRHIGVVLGGGAHHGRAADVDVFDCRGPANAGIGHGFAEGIEVHHHHVDRIDRLGGQIGLVGGVVALGQDAAMDPRVQGFDPAAEDFRGTGVLGHPGHRQARRLQGRGRAATGEQAKAMQPVQGFGQGHQPPLVRHTQKGRRGHRAHWG